MITIKRIVAILLLLTCLFSVNGCKVGFYSDEIIIEESTNEIRFSVSGMDTLNPIKTKSTSVREMLSLIYNPLYTFNEKLEPEPCLAEKLTWLSDVSARLELKRDITWHSGLPLTADDIIYTINEIKNSDSIYKSCINSIADAYVNESGEFILDFKWPVMNVEGLLSFPVIRNGTMTEIGETPDGTGEYKLVEKSASELILKSTDGHSPVRVSVIRTPNACVNTFEAGDLDLISSSVLNLDEVTPAGEISKYYYPSNNLTFLGFNTARFNSPYIRIAVSNLIDRDALVDSAMFGMAKAVKLPINPASSLYSENELLEYDIAGSIEAAGYKKDGKIYVDESGEPLSLEILVCIDNVRKVEVANQISAKLNTEGISSYVITADYDTYKSRIKKMDYDTFIGEVKMPYNLDPGFMTEKGNYFKYENAELDDVLFAMRASRTLDELKTHISNYERIFKVEQPFVPLFYKCEGVIYKKNVSGISEPNFYNSLRGIESIYFNSSVKR